MPEELVKVEEVPVVVGEVKVEEKLVEKVEEKPVVVELEPEAKPVAVANVKSKFVFFFFFWHDHWHLDGILYLKYGHRVVYDAASRSDGK